ncbi:MAG: transcription termination/antitermination protein NusG [Elusimicrobiota bacterium]
MNEEDKGREIEQQEAAEEKTVPYAEEINKKDREEQIAVPVTEEGSEMAEEQDEIPIAAAEATPVQNIASQDETGGSAREEVETAPDAAVSAGEASEEEEEPEIAAGTAESSNLADETAQAVPETAEVDLTEKIFSAEIPGRPDVKWYVINTYTGHEKKVKNYIEKLKQSNKDLTGKIYDILIPYNEIVTLRKGKKQIIDKEFFPGYVLIHMCVDDETYWTLKNIPGVTDFLCGKKERPVPLTKSEFKKIKDMIEKKMEEEPQSAISFKEGDRVRIIDGPFDNFMGVVESGDDSKQKVRVMVTIFGRTTPVELDFLQVEKA